MKIEPKPSTWPARRKFLKGPEFRNPLEAVDWIIRGKWCYWCDTPKHPSVVQNFSLTTIMGAARNGRLRPALRAEP